MDVIVRKQYITINPFELRDLPDLVVLTGENGTGKTQLLEYLYYGSRLNDNGGLEVITEDDESLEQGDGYLFHRKTKSVIINS